MTGARPGPSGWTASRTAGPGRAVLGLGPPDLDVDATFSRDPWQFGTGEEVEVDVLVDGAESGRVVAELGPSVVVEHRADGAVVVRLSVSDEEAFILWVLDLLDHAEVLAPASVRTAVVDRLRSTLAAAQASR